MNKMSLFTTAMAFLILFSAPGMIRKRELSADIRKLLLICYCGVILVILEKFLKYYGVVGGSETSRIIIDIFNIVFYLLLYYFSPDDLKNVSKYFLLWSVLTFFAARMIKYEKDGQIYSAGIFLGLVALVIMWIGLMKGLTMAARGFKKSTFSDKKT